MSQYSGLLRAIADGKRLQTAYEGVWYPMTEKAAFERMARGDDIEWREALRMARQVACDVPEPLRVRPKIGEQYYCPSFSPAPGAILQVCGRGADDLGFFSAGLCYATKEEATARARAMLQIESV